MAAVNPPGEAGGVDVPCEVDGRELKGGGLLVLLASTEAARVGPPRIGSMSATFRGDGFVDDGRGPLDMIDALEDRIDVPLDTPPTLSQNASVPVDWLDSTELERDRAAPGSGLYVNPKSPGCRSSVGFRYSRSGSGSGISSTDASGSSSSSFSASLSCSAGAMMYCGTYSDCDSRLSFASSLPGDWLPSSHIDEGAMHAFRVVNDSPPPADPNDIVMASAPEDVEGRTSLSKLKTERLSSTSEGLVGPCEDVLLRALDPENSLFLGFVMLPRFGSTFGEEGGGSESALAEGWLTEERKPGNGGRMPRLPWKDRCLRGVLLGWGDP